MTLFLRVACHCARRQKAGHVWALILCGSVCLHLAGGNCRIDSLDGYLYCPDEGSPSSGPGSEFSLFAASSLSPVNGLSVNSAVLFKSVLTGKYCRVVTRSGVQVDESQQIKCDIDSPSLATPMVFNGTYILSEEGRPITSPCDSCPVYIGGSGTPGSINPGERTASKHIAATQSCTPNNTCA
jgi:hypothetical protein